MADPVVTALSLFSGAGGLELGLHLAVPGLRVVGYVERDAYAAACLLARMEDQALDPAPVWCGDIAELDAGLFRGVDLVCGGFPCQPASSAGRRRGTGDERWLWPEFARVVRATRPRLVFVENVAGLLTVNGGGAFGEVVEDLAALGFDAEWDIFSAAEVGAPHRRERLFLLAYRDMADAAGLRKREPHHSAPALGGERSRPSTGSGSIEMANPRGGRRGQGPGAVPAGEPEPRPDVVAVALANGQRRELANLRPGDGTRRLGQPDGRRGDVEFTQGDGRRIQGLLDGLRSARRDAAMGHADLGHVAVGGRHALARPLAAPFPPGPADADAWRAILATRPDLAPAVEPAVRGVADGLARGLEFRIDRLRVLGNGVVPLEAAVAFRALAARTGVAMTAQTWEAADA